MKNPLKTIQPNDFYLTEPYTTVSMTINHDFTDGATMCESNGCDTAPTHTLIGEDMESDAVRRFTLCEHHCTIISQLSDFDTYRIMEIEKE